MAKRKPIPEGGSCCICGLAYERIGNNPHPLAMVGRCCDACGEVVIEARLGVLKMADVERVENAVRLKLLETGDMRQMALAAICALRGPGLLAEKKRQLAKLAELTEE